MRKGKLRRLVRRGDVRGLAAVLGHAEVVEHGVERVDLAVPDRVEAAWALGGLDGEDATLALVRAARDPEVEVRRAALAALAGDGASRAVDATPLASALARWPLDDPSGLLAAERVFAELDAPDRGPRLAEALLATGRAPVDVANTLRRVLADAPDPTEEDRCVQLLVDAVTDDSDGADGLRARAEVVLAWLGGAPVDALMGALERRRSRPTVAAALGRTGERRAGTALVALLSEPDPDLRRAAVRGLADVADPRTLEALLSACDDEDHGVRAAALDAVDGFGVAAVTFGVAGALRGDLAQLEARVEALGRVMVERPSAGGGRLGGGSAAGLESPADTTTGSGLRRLQRLLGRG